MINLHHSGILSAHETAFFSAAENNNLDSLISNLERVENINIVDSIGETALIKACKMNYSEIVNFLLENGADCKIPSNNGWGAIHYATYYECSETVKLLLAKDRSLANLECEQGRRPLHIAAMGKSSDIVMALVNAGADPKASALDGAGLEVSALELAEDNFSSHGKEIQTLIRGAIEAQMIESNGVSHASASSFYQTQTTRTQGKSLE